MAELATPLSMSQDPLIVTLRARLRRARTHAERYRAVLEALVEHDNDGLRNGRQHDAIVDAAREVLCASDPA